ncbi:MAG: hypothetical protein HKL95_03625 [Phycisphaerae bacterium]|nr:hypothetical protein [Phycisphaerae bacterium]
MSAASREILRRLAGELGAIAAAPGHSETARLWTQLNDLQSVRPMVWINEIPWHEMNVNEEMTLRCGEPWAKQQEFHLRRLLYQWRHLPADMIISDYLPCPLVIENTGFGLEEDVDTISTDAANSVISRHFNRQIMNPKDLEKIKPAVVHHDVTATEANYQLLCDVYADILPVRKEGIKHIWYTPWDNLIRWWGVQDAMLDLVDRPDMVNEAVTRCAASMHAGLDQMIEQNLLSLGVDNTRVGSGGYGYTTALPEANFDSAYVRPIDNWGCSNAQIFSEVSPEMHWEFALRHDIPWLQRWGLNYYGCCEPLDFKMDILRRIPRLRKISMNYRIKLSRAVVAVGADYVFSYKPNPAPLAEDRWRPDVVRDELRQVLEMTRGMHVEIIMKDISTVRYQPQRLWEWQQIAMDLVRQTRH